jgi:hypothetical protein
VLLAHQLTAGDADVRIKSEQCKLETATPFSALVLCEMAERVVVPKGI